MQEPQTYTIIDSDGYWVGTWTTTNDDPQPSTVLAPGQVAQLGWVTFLQPPPRTVPPRDSGIKIAYHVARGRWENTQTGQQYPQPTMTVTQL